MGKYIRENIFLCIIDDDLFVVKLVRNMIKKWYKNVFFNKMRGRIYFNRSV